MTGAVWLIDAQGRLLVCNRQFAEMYALPAALTKPGTVHCALWEYREKHGGKHYPSGSRSFTPDAGYPETMTIEFGNERIEFFVGS